MAQHQHPSRSQADLDPEVCLLAEKFADQLRRGIVSDIEGWARQYPSHADSIRHLFPAIVAMENVAIENNPNQPSNGLFMEPPTKQMGPYRIVRELGRGGMGIVYLAEQADLERQVALKILPREFTEDDSRIARFRREARTAAQMDHEHIVAVYDVATETLNGAEWNYFTMQFIDGQSLDKVIANLVARSNEDHPPTSTHEEQASHSTQQTRDLLARVANPSNPEASSPSNSFVDSLSGKVFQTAHAYWSKLAQIALEGADALAHAHAKEVLHRDIKPSNLIVDLSGKTWVTDFGLAKVQNTHATQTEGVVGTLRFLAPERFRGWADPRSDIYSLGMTLYELATLQPAFQDEDRAKLVSKVVGGECRPPRQVNPRIPFDLETIILKATEPEPALRYQTATELKEDLRCFIDQRPIHAQRRSKWSRFVQSCRRHPLITGLVATLLTILAAIAIASTITAVAFNELASELDQQKTKTTKQLLLAYVNQAHTTSVSRQPGQRLGTIAAIQNALKLLPTVEHDRQHIFSLRNSLITALSLYDLQLEDEMEITGIYTPALSPDFEYVAFVDNRNCFRFRRRRDGTELWNYQFESSFDRAWSTFSPSGKYVAVGYPSLDQQLIFETETGRKLGAVDAFSWLYKPLDFSDDETRILTCAKRDGMPALVLYSLIDDMLEETLVIHSPISILQAYFAADEEQLVAFDPEAKNDKLFVYDLTDQTGQVIQMTGKLVGLELNRSRTSMAVGRIDGGLDLYASPSGNAFRSFPPQKDQVRYLKFSPDEQLLLSRAWFNTIHLWEVATGELVFEFWGRMFQFNNDSSRVAFEVEGKLKIFRIVSPSILQQARDQIGHHLAFHPQDDWIAAAHDGGLVIRDRENLELIQQVTREATSSCEFLSNGTLIYPFRDGIYAVQVSGRGSQALTNQPRRLIPIKANSLFRFVTLSTNKKVLAWTHASDRIRIANVETLMTFREIQVQPKFYYTAFRLNRDGTRLALMDPKPAVYDVQTGELLFQGPQEAAGDYQHQPQFSHDSEQLICSCRDKYFLFDIKNNKLLKEFPSSNFGGHADWSPDGKLLAMVKDQGQILLVDARTFEEITILRTPRLTGIRDLSFEADVLFAYGSDGEIFRWDMSAIRNWLARFNLDW